jgi:hypothetical protein
LGLVRAWLADSIHDAVRRTVPSDWDAWAMPYERVADIALAGGVIIRYGRSGRPIAFVFLHASDIVARPPVARGLALLLAARLVAIAELFGGRRDRPTFVPREWVTEFHAVSTASGSRPIG